MRENGSPNDDGPSAPVALHCRRLQLVALDREWSSYLADMADIREGIHLRRFGRQDPLYEFNRIAIDRFATVFSDAERQAVDGFKALQYAGGSKPLPEDPAMHPSAT